jgi:hypothetical protein
LELISMAGAPEGNQNAAKSKRLFNSALKRALTQKPERVEAIVEKLITLAEGGEQWAVKELIDRVDGKAPQPVVGGDDEDNPLRVEKIERVIVRAQASDSNG